MTRVLVTRPAERAGDVAALLREAGLEPVCLPLLETRPVVDLAPLDRALAHLSDVDWVVFASATAAGIVLDRARQLGVPLGTTGTPRVCAGPATATALVEGGWRTDLVVAPYTAERAAAALLPHLGRGARVRARVRARVLLPRAAAGQDVLAASLREAGATVHDLPLYETVPVPARAAEAAARLLAGEFRAVLFCSPSAVDALRPSLAGAPLPAGVLVACIGPTTADAAARAGLQVDVVAPDTTARSLVTALATHLGELALATAGGGR